MRLFKFTITILLGFGLLAFAESPTDAETEISPQEIIGKFLAERDSTNTFQKLAPIENRVKEGVLEKADIEEIARLVGNLETKDALRIQLFIIDEIKVYVDKRFLPTLLGVKSMIEWTLANVLKNPESLKTMREKTNLVVFFRSSNTFFQDIVAEISAVKIACLQSIAEDNIAKNMEFDEALRPTLTQSTFQQLHRLVVDLGKRDIDEGLKEKLHQLIPNLGRVLASAKQGDSKPVFDEALPVCEEIRGLYPEFIRLPTANQAYQVAQEIQNLTEFFIRHAGLDQQ